jgi:hypothetical protein
MAEDPKELSELIARLYSFVTDQDPDATPYTPATAHTFGDDAESVDIELLREQHAFFIFGMFDKFPKYMISQDGGQPWFLFWLTNALEVCN